MTLQMELNAGQAGRTGAIGKVDSDLTAEGVRIRFERVYTVMQEQQSMYEDSRRALAG